MRGLLFLFDKKMNARKSARKSAAIFFSLDYERILRDFMSFARKSEANFFSLDYFIPLRNFISFGKT